MNAEERTTKLSTELYARCERNRGRLRKRWKDNFLPEK